MIVERPSQQGQNSLTRAEIDKLTGLFAAVVATFGTIALSKRSTDKERMLMLDELEIEMDVCEKEMSRAESNGQIKKYRALSYRMVKLKREYQRIKYNVKISDYARNQVMNKNK